jgi:translation initiation factor 1 (eIF-1/SUI1)
MAPKKQPGGKKQKRKTKELIVGSDVEESSSEDSSTEKEVPAPAPAPKEKAAPSAMKGKEVAKKPEAEGEKAIEPAPEAKEKPSDAGKSAGDAPADDQEVGPVAVTKHAPISVMYCPVCTFPAEMCEFSGMLEKCKPWLLENASLLEAEAANLAAAEEKGRKQKAPGEKKTGGEQVILLATKKRGAKNKMVTHVHGLDAFGHSLKELANIFKKKFQCGVTVTDVPGLPDAVEIQGEVQDEVAAFLQAAPYNISIKQMFVLGKANGRTPLA